MTYDQTQLDDLFARARSVLGPEVLATFANCKPRQDAFMTALFRAVKAMEGPSNVTDGQILGALEIADEGFPLELEVMARAYYREPKA